MSPLSLRQPLAGLIHAALFVACVSGAPAPVARAPRPRLGMNLSGPADWNTELPFVDVFRLSRRWISQREGAPWGAGPELDLDEHGWIRRLEPHCWADTPLCTIRGGHYPGGLYTVLYDGKGRIEFSGAATVVSEQPGRMTIEVDPAKGGFFLRLMRTDPSDYVRNIHVVMPGFENSFRNDPWHPAFLKRWQGIACFRFMDWMKTNGSRVATWEERPKLDDATFTTNGVPLELMIDLCNRLKADGWFCMPHMADDGYVRNFARMLKERLDPGLKAYIEYSNEVWNGQFPQNRYAAEQGQQLGFGEKPWEAAWRYTAYRSVQIFDIFEQVFGGTDRIVRVLPSQAANPYVSEQILNFRDAYRHADALAIAPYIGFIVPARGEALTAEQVQNWTLDQVFDHIQKVCLPRAVENMRKQKAVADRYGLLLVAYEGGQHLVGARGGENYERLTKLFQAANADSRMALFYDRYFAAWTQAGGDLFCYFSSVGRWSKWGSWGIMQYYDEDPAASPKFTATMRWARQCGQPVNLPGGAR